VADIRHLIQINASVERIRPLFSSAKGFSHWWAADSVEGESEGSVELGFFSRSTVYRLRQGEQTPNEIAWRCDRGKEWNGTTLHFRLEPTGKATLLHFTHGGWNEETEYFVTCNTTWGELMYRLKAAAEGKTPVPLFTMDGLAC